MPLTMGSEAIKPDRGPVLGRLAPVTLEPCLDGQRHGSGIAAREQRCPSGTEAEAQPDPESFGTRIGIFLGRVPREGGRDQGRKDGWGGDRESDIWARSARETTGVISYSCDAD